ncbi:hypothetical protein [Ruegeria atlantica]|uniref:hypothetical protein n=1 Tax=Ruegeria atlantica TaxID=81569 RepID=UPI00147EE499|nr:hypothetical protein [Ruegeria atlantica]
MKLIAAGGLFLSLAACETPEEIAAAYQTRSCTALAQEQGALQYQLDQANTDLAVSTIAGIVTNDDDILLDSDIAGFVVDDLEDRLRILADVQRAKGCV